MYLLDANVFITPKREYYAFDLAPGYWDFILQEYQKNNIASIDSVYRELSGSGDDLSHWVKHNKHLFINTTRVSNLDASLSAITSWVMAPDRYTTDASEDFLGCGADMDLIAYAMVSGDVVVTYEKSDPRRKNKVKIPDVCRAMGVNCVPPYDMLRALKFSLHL